MTTGFQQQHQAYGPSLKSLARPQHVGAKLVSDEARTVSPLREAPTFKKPRV